MAEVSNTTTPDPKSITPKTQQGSKSQAETAGGSQSQKKETKQVSLFGNVKPGESASIFKLAPGKMSIFDSTKAMIQEDKERKAKEGESGKKEFNAAALFGTSYNLGTEAKKNTNSPFFSAGGNNLFAEAKKGKDQEETKQEQEKKEESAAKLKDIYRKTTIPADSNYYKMFQISVVKFTVGNQNRGQGMLSFEVQKEGEGKPVAGDKLKSAIIVLRNTLGKMRFQGIMMRPLTRTQKNEEKPGKIMSDLWIPSKGADGKLKLAKCKLKFKFAWDRTQYEEAFKTVLQMLPRPEK